MEHPDTTYWATWHRVEDCVKKRFVKNQPFGVNEFRERCGIDYGTAAKYLPLLEGKDLGNGKKVVSTTVAVPGYVVDPPWDDSLKIAQKTCCNACGCNESRSDSGSYILLGVACLAVGALIGVTIINGRNRSNWSCNWCGTVTTTAYDQLVFACPACGFVPRK